MRAAQIFGRPRFYALNNRRHFSVESFPGLLLDAPAMIEGNLARALSTLQRGLAMAEHGEFARKLEQSVAPRPADER